MQPLRRRLSCSLTLSFSVRSGGDPAGKNHLALCKLTARGQALGGTIPRSSRVGANSNFLFSSVIHIGQSTARTSFRVTFSSKPPATCSTIPHDGFVFFLSFLRSPPAIPCDVSRG